MDFADSTVVITGAGRGIGKRMAERFASGGADIVVADIEGAEEAAEDLSASALGVKTDITDPDDVEHLATETIDRFGSIDVLVNNAAIYGPLVPKRDRRYDEIPVDEWREVLDVNTTGMFICCQELVPYMEEQGHGSVVNISSAVMYGRATGYPHYVTSKGAVPSLTRAIAAEAGENGVRVNAVAPGLVTTEASQQLDQAYLDAIADQQALPHNGTPEEIVDTVEFLASEKASFIAGSVLHPDGGLTYR